MPMWGRREVYWENGGAGAEHHAVMLDQRPRVEPLIPIQGA